MVVALEGPGVGSAAPLCGPLPWRPLQQSISAEREVPSPICEGGGNNTSRFVVGSYAATRIGSFKLDNSPLSEAQILIYQMRKPKLLSWKDLNPCVQTGEPTHLTITLPAASRSRVRVYSRPPPSSRALCSPTLLWALKSGKYQRVIVGIANWAAGVPNFSPRSATNLCVILGLSVLLRAQFHHYFNDTINKL